jgi:hypothetical protein
MRLCKVCGNGYYAKDLCRKCYLNTPEQKAWKKWYNALPEVKAKKKAWIESPEGRAYEQSRRVSPERKAYKKANDKARRESPKGIACEKAREATPERKTFHLNYMKSKEGRMVDFRSKAKRRSLGHEIINPELEATPGFHGHHIDKNHILYIPTKLHKRIWHGLKWPDKMERINTVAYAWLLGVSID